MSIKTFAAYKQSFKNLSFRNKIALTSLIIGLFPVILLGTFSYYQIKTQLMEREQASLKDTIGQEVQNLDYKFNSHLAAINFITWNESLRSALSQKYTNNYDMYLVYRDTLDPILTTVRNISSSVDSITIYSNGSLNPHGNNLRSLEEAVPMEWYSIALNNTTPTFVLSQDKKKLYLVCQVYYYHISDINLVCITIDGEDIFSSLNTLHQNSYGVLIKEKDMDIPPFIEMSGMEKQGSSYVMEARDFSSVDWTLFLTHPVEAVSSSAKKIILLVLFMILLSLIIISVSSILLAKLVTRPLNALSENMKLIEQDNLTITISSESTDEIGQLVQSFTHMVNRLNYLINEVLKSKIAQQEYEMKVLQAQISPHFLYNSLSMINSKAIITGQKDISKMAQLLSTFYRTTLNKGKNITSVLDELSNIRSYIDIQRMMHSDSFDIIYEIDEDILPFSMPNLLIQPLVENSILHGLDHKVIGGKGILTICAYRDYNDLCFRIMDNGCGMSSDECITILTSTSHGYGVQNVHQRIRLFCGDHYGLTYSSTIGLGTSALLRLKAVELSTSE